MKFLAWLTKLIIFIACTAAIVKALLEGGMK